MTHPIFARGRSSETNTSATVKAGSDLIPVLNANSYFTSGDLVFISCSDDSDLECLGVVISATSSYLTSSWSLARAKEIGSKIWKAETFFRWLVPRIFPCEKKIDTGVRQLRSIGGNSFSTRIYPLRTIEILQLERASKSHLESFLLWAENYLSGGLYSFTYVDCHREISKVQLISTQPSFKEEIAGMFNIALELEVLQKGVYE